MPRGRLIQYAHLIRPGNSLSDGNGTQVLLFKQWGHLLHLALAEPTQLLGQPLQALGCMNMLVERMKLWRHCIQLLYSPRRLPADLLGRLVCAPGPTLVGDPVAA